MRRRVIKVFVALAVIAAAGVAFNGYYFPYGRSHCCDKQLHMALLSYADQHGGWFPRGEASPEASLSLLYRADSEAVSANLLRGKTVPVADVEARLTAGDLLTPETCGWHYVEGLRQDDDSRLALFWDKVGLGHNGERLRRDRYVHLIDGSGEFIPTERWAEFLAEQEQLRAAVKRP